MLLINIFGSQTWKSSGTEAGLSSSVSSSAVNSIWVLGHMGNQHPFNKPNQIESRQKTSPVELFLREWTVTTLTSKVLILRTFQTYYWISKQLHTWPKWDYSRWWWDLEFIQYLLRTYNMPDTLAWGKCIPHTWQILEAVAVGFYIIYPECQISRCVRNLLVYLDSKQTFWLEVLKIMLSIFLPLSYFSFLCNVGSIKIWASQDAERSSQNISNVFRIRGPRLCARWLWTCWMPLLNKFTIKQGVKVSSKPLKESDEQKV